MKEPIKSAWRSVRSFVDRGIGDKDDIQYVVARGSEVRHCDCEEVFASMDFERMIVNGARDVAADYLKEDSEKIKEMDKHLANLDAQAGSFEGMLKTVAKKQSEEIMHHMERLRETVLAHGQQINRIQHRISKLEDQSALKKAITQILSESKDAKEGNKDGLS